MDNPVVLITGALTGIGRATAIEFAKQSARIVVSGRRDKEGKALEAELLVLARTRSSSGPMCAMTKTLPHCWRRPFPLRTGRRRGQQCGHGGTAGTDRPADGRELRPPRSRTNVLGVLLCLKHEMRLMLAQGYGSIINISSTYGHRGGAGASVYAASKHAVEGLTKCAALEAAASGVRVNAVAPGPTDTGMLDRFTGSPQRKAAMASAVPLGRAGRPDEIARAIVFLASDAASFITGQIVAADGGKSAG